MMAQQGELMQTLLHLLQQAQSDRSAREEASSDLIERMGRALVEASARQAAAEAQVRLLGAPEGAETPTRPAPEGVLGRALRWAERH
jgi:hypothetical protein